MDDQDDYMAITNSALYKVRQILWQASGAHPDIPYTIIVSLLAESAMLTEDVSAWLLGLMKDAHECTELRMKALVDESARSIHH